MRALGCWLVVFVVAACGDNHPSTVDASVDAGPPRPQCSDNVDNDGDGKIDFPNDPGCAASLVDDEDDNCPTVCSQCGDGQDNDGNGKIDFPDDTGCTSAADLVEFTDDPNACGQGMAIKPLPLTGIDTGTLVGTTSSVSSPCGGGNGLPGIAYVFHLQTPRVMVATTDDPMTMIDSVLDLRSSMCQAPGAELACHDDLIASSNRRSKITKALKAGTYYLIVHGKTAADTGTYTLDVRFHPGEGAQCMTTADCGPELECRVPANSTQKQCIGPVCNDGIDDDNDGKLDFPLDPGCATPTDDNEQDVCAMAPQSPQCPQCANGVDDDNDGMIDYPLDTNCRSAGHTSESCPQSEAVGVITAMTTMGTTAAAVNDYTPTCGGTTHTAGDLAYELNVPAMATLSLNLTGFDGAHSLLDSTCGGAPIACSDPNLLTRTNVAAGRYYVIVDGWGSSSGAFTLTTTGTVAPNGSCEGALFQSGAFTCSAGFACTGTVGSRTCTPSPCNDTADNDGDGKTDYPADPGCSSTTDASEADTCPTGPDCPACGNGLDDDMDTMIDYPSDTRCASASFFLEAFCPMEADIAGMVVSRTSTGTLATAADNFTQSCQSTTGNDATFGLRLPVPVASLQIDTIGSVATDTIVSLWNSSCMMSLGCDDDGDPAGFLSLLTVTNVPAGDYAIQVDGYGTSNNTGITLNVFGTVAAGTACTSELFASGVLQCAMGTSCTAGICQ